ncbi:MAG: TolC family protein [Nitrospirae bacterium]|nr:TolC family protein [Nitrospirota bacterium]
MQDSRYMIHDKKKLASCILYLASFLFTVHYSLFTAPAFAENLTLLDLINEALKNNHEILMAKSRWKGSSYKIPQVKTLPDPMFMVQYQNEGWERYTFGEMEGAQWMFSATQMLPFPGKLGLKAEEANWDSKSFEAGYNAARLQIISKVKTIYYNLCLAYKSLDILNEKRSVLDTIESSALSRYSTGMASQQDVLMVQTEKSMLIEKEEMLKQRLKSFEAALNMILGRQIESPVSKPPDDIAPSTFSYSFEELEGKAVSLSPELLIREKMIKASETKVEMAKKEYYPDFTLTASVSKRRDPFEDMWSLGIGINIPLFYKTKQRMAVLESDSALSQAIHDYKEMKQRVSFEIKDSLLMIKTSERLSELYKNSLIPQADLFVKSSIASYSTGKIEMASVLKNLQSFLENKLQYYTQVIEREKAIARLEAITGLDAYMQGKGGKRDE